MNVLIKEITPKHIITQSKLPGIEYCVNPYTGCSHACVYCYARFMKRFSNHNEDWGTFVDIKINAAETCAADIRKIKPNTTLMFGTVTDCYQPLESKYRLTRSILEQIAALPEKPFHVSLLTKSDLILRDIDLLEKIPSVSVGFSVAWHDEQARKIFDPHCPPIHRRMAALTTLRNAGVSVFAFIGPILPGITDLPEIFRMLNGSVSTIHGETLNLSCGNLQNVLHAVHQYNPALRTSFEKNIRDAQYWTSVQREFLKLAGTYGMTIEGFYRHPTERGIVSTLFSV
ncbi:MAG: radical SAM protein [Planctomycetaceae bacterium]|jgi:DNA repair photolyase|nr:radical SAM protein [Planctomycetaceae bacterium]